MGLVKDNLKWHHFIKCYALLKMSRNNFFFYGRDCMSVSNAQVQLFRKCQCDKCGVVDSHQSICAGVCLCSGFKSMAAEVMFDSQQSCTGEKAICCFFPKWKREKSQPG